MASTPQHGRKGVFFFFFEKERKKEKKKKRLSHFTVKGFRMRPESVQGMKNKTKKKGQKVFQHKETRQPMTFTNPLFFYNKSEQSNTK